MYNAAMNMWNMFDKFAQYYIWLRLLVYLPKNCTKINLYTYRLVLWSTILEVLTENLNYGTNNNTYEDKKQGDEFWGCL